MHGLIFDTVKSLVMQKFGLQTWEKLSSSAGISFDIDYSQPFSDQLFYDLLEKSSAILNLPVDTILEVAGYHFIVFIKETEYGTLLSMSGSTLADILQNINSLHGHMRLSYFQNMSPPNFRTTNVTATSLKLHYFPGRVTRRGLGPLIIGIVKALSEKHFGWEPSRLKIVQEKFISKGAQKDVFNISWKGGKESVEDQLPLATTSPVKTERLFGLEPDGLNIAFPFHFVMNSKLQILQTGESLNKILLIKKEDLLTKHFKLLRPRLEKVDYKEIRHNLTEDFLFSFAFDDLVSLEIRGQFILSRKEKTKRLTFVGSPIFSSMKQAIYVGLSLSDFAPHDFSKDRLFQVDSSQIQESRRSSSNSLSDHSDLSEVDDLSEMDSIVATPKSKMVRGNSKTDNRVPSSHQAELSTSGPPGCPFPKGLSIPLNAFKGYSSASSSSSSDQKSLPAKNFDVRHLVTPEGRTLHQILKKDALSGFVQIKALIETLMGDPELNTAIAGIFSILSVENQLFNFLIQCFRWETSSKVSAAEVLRQDTISSLSLSLFFQKSCSPVVRGVVEAALSAMLNHPQLKDRQDPTALCAVSQAALEQLVTTSSSWPLCATYLLQTVLSELTTQNSDIAYNSICSLLFLRLINPSLSSPERVQLFSSRLDGNYRSCLLVVSKMLSNLLNGGSFSKPDQKDLNKFTTSENQIKTNSFFNRLLEGASDAATANHSAHQLQQIFVASPASHLQLSEVLHKKMDLLWEAAVEDVSLKSFLMDLMKAQLIE